VVVPLRHKQAFGIISAVVARPQFATKAIISAPELPPIPEALQQLLTWMRGFYPAPLGIITQLFLPDALSKKDLAANGTGGDLQLEKQSLPPLTHDQQVAISNITAPGLHLLHGETGSGKTRVYVELARRSYDHPDSRDWPDVSVSRHL
jgi:primosomal protein N'